MEIRREIIRLCLFSAAVLFVTCMATLPLVLAEEATQDGPVPIVSLKGVQDGPDPSDSQEWLVLQRCDVQDCEDKAWFACTFSDGMDTAEVDHMFGTCSYTCKDGTSGSEPCKPRIVVVM